jgi:LexA-binding, inner membrane-associated putative hydrolase
MTKHHNALHFTLDKCSALSALHELERRVKEIHIPTHLMLSWVVGHRLTARRDRALVAWAGLAPDLDGLSLIAGADAYGRWHHVLTHGLVAALLVGTLLSWGGKDRLKVWWLSLCAFHLHLLCDLLGSGTSWPMQYLWPLSETFYGIAYGWEFDSWQNFAVAITALILCGHIAIRRGYSFAEAFLPRAADVAIVAALRQRFSPQGTRSLGRETRLFGSATLEGTQHRQ